MSESLNCALAYSVGNEKLDGQHQKLLTLCHEAERLPDNADAGLAEKFQDILEELCHYVEEHFRDEEALLQAGHFPDLAAHKKEHDEFITQLSKIYFEASKGIIQTKHLHDLLSGWLIHHILDSDMKYKDYFSRC